MVGAQYQMEFHSTITAHITTHTATAIIMLSTTAWFTVGLYSTTTNYENLEVHDGNNTHSRNSGVSEASYLGVYAVYHQ